MQIMFKRISVTLICSICLFAGHVMAEEKVNFSDESVIREILLNNRWMCGVGDDSGWGGQSEWKFEKLDGRKVSGTYQQDNCTVGVGGGHDGTFKGSVKKNTLKFSVKISGGRCSNYSGKLKFFREDESSYRAEGRFNRTYNGSPYRGTLWCYIDNK